MVVPIRQLDDFEKKFSKSFSLLDLYNKLGGVPSPDGTFLPHSGIEVGEGILITPYGLLTTEHGAQLHLHLSENLAGEYSVHIQFTSFPIPIEGVIEYETISGKIEEVPTEVLRSGRCGAVFLAEEPLARITLEIRTRPVIFSVHEVQVQYRSATECAEQDVRVESPSYDILCFGVIDWDFRFQRPQQILSRLAQAGHRVAYVGVQFLSPTDEQVESRQVSDRITLLKLPGNPRVSPYQDEPSQGSIERGVLALRKFLEGHCFNEVVMLIHLPFWLPYAEELKRLYGWKMVYDCMDDHTGFAHNSPRLDDIEEELVERCDLLISSSQVLYDKQSKRTKAPHILVRNAGEFAHFAKLPVRAHPTVAGFNGPVIGYYGALAEWFDIDALLYAARELSEAHFVLIGHVTEEGFNACKDLQNIHFLGEKPYRELPGYLTAFDVCTIPFRRIPLTEATNPVKVYEYLASGKPVVARDLPELVELKDTVRLYGTKEEFVVQLRAALKERGKKYEVQRRQVALENTWEDRVHAVSEGIESLYKKVGIVVVSYGQFEKLRKCVQSLLKYTEYPRYEIYLVDNASPGAIRDYLAELARLDTRIKVIQNTENKGFAAANNQALRELSDANYFILLNNDTEVTPGWVSRLVWYADRPDIGAVGPVTNWIGNEAQIRTLYKTTEDMISFARCISKIHRGDYFDIKVLAMFCMAIRREVLDKVGYLDEDFGIGMFEDDDYSNRLRQAGYRVVCAEDVFIHHAGKSAFKKMDSEEYQKLFERNKRIFEKKWGKWVPHVYRKQKE